MTDLITEFPFTVSDARGSCRAWAVARQRADGSWEGWLEFVPANRDSALVYAAPVETHRDDRAMIAQWASSLTYVDATRAFSLATVRPASRPALDLLLTLEELVEALDRRRPQIERVGEAEIVADANHLRACAVQSIALLRQSRSEPKP